MRVCQKTKCSFRNLQIVSILYKNYFDIWLQIVS